MPAQSGLLATALGTCGGFLLATALHAQAGGQGLPWRGAGPRRASASTVA